MAHCSRAHRPISGATTHDSGRPSRSGHKRRASKLTQELVYQSGLRPPIAAFASGVGAPDAASVRLLMRSRRGIRRRPQETAPRTTSERRRSRTLTASRSAWRPQEESIGCSLAARQVCARLFASSCHAVTAESSVRGCHERGWRDFRPIRFPRSQSRHTFRDSGERRCAERPLLVEVSASVHALNGAAGPSVCM